MYKNKTLFKVLYLCVLCFLYINRVFSLIVTSISSFISLPPPFMIMAYAIKGVLLSKQPVGTQEGGVERDKAMKNFQNIYVLRSGAVRGGGGGGGGGYPWVRGDGNAVNLYVLSYTGVGSLIRHVFSTSTKRHSSNDPEFLAKEHINSGETTTATVINKILLNQDIYITDNKLEELLKVKGVEIDFPVVTPKDKKLLAELTGISKYKGFFGVYIFEHKNTGQKYVGSSNLLRRRMDYYFKGDFPLTTKFLSFLHQEGLGAFKLVIYKLDDNKFSNKDALLLEQYFLLSKEFNLNTLRVVNAGSSKGKSVYVYDLSCSTLYYHAKSQIDLKRVLKIHIDTCKKYIDTKIPYLNNFLLLSYPIPTALSSNITVKELVDIMQKERRAIYVLGTRRNIPVTLEIMEGNYLVDYSLIGHTLNFDSLTYCIKYLRKLGLTIKRDTLTKYIKNEKVFYYFLCKYTDKFKPVDFEEVGLIIDEYKKLKVDSDSLKKVNKKNKPILVKGVCSNFEKRFESIMDLIRHFKTLGIKLDRKSLYICLKEGKEYKGYFFFYDF